MIAAQVADCPPGFDGWNRRRPPVRRGEAWGSGRSNDGTLEWSTAVAADCGRTFTVSINRGGALTEVFRREAPPPAAPEGQPAPICSA
jgi:hypothetical protein